MYKDGIIKALQKATGEKEIKVETPEIEEHGDYTTNIALQVKGQKSNVKSAMEFAEAIASEIRNSKLEIRNYLEKVEVAGPGFINFYLKTDALIDNLIQIDRSKDKFGGSAFGKGKTVIIDYSSPNIAKAFGIGHLRSTLIGQALYNLFQAVGFKVIGDNHLGDWGTQFGKLIYMIKTKNPKDLNLETLEKLYVEFHKLAEKDEKLEEEARGWFKKLEEGDPEVVSIWKKCYDISMAEFDRIYEILGVKIDLAYGESFYQKEMQDLIEGYKRSGWKGLKDGEGGAKIVDLEDQGIKTPLMFLKSDGATTYATRDLATLRFRKRKWDPDIVIYEVGGEQALYFQQVFAAAKKLGIVSINVELVHTKHGLYLSESGKKFSTREGETVKLEEVLTEAVEKAKTLGEVDDKTAKMVGIGAIKYYDLMHSVQSDIIFDWGKIINIEGNSGPYIQYTYARTQSVLAKLKIQNPKSQKNLSFDFENLELNDEEAKLLRSFIHFPEVIEDAAENYAPNLLCNYLYNLAQKYNTFYQKYRIIIQYSKIKSQNDKAKLKNISENKTVEQFRLALTQATGQILKNGLNILGIEAPQKM